MRALALEEVGVVSGGFWADDGYGNETWYSDANKKKVEHTGGGSGSSTAAIGWAGGAAVGGFLGNRFDAAMVGAWSWLTTPPAGNSVTGLINFGAASTVNAGAAPASSSIGSKEPTSEYVGGGGSVDSGNQAYTNMDGLPTDDGGPYKRARL